MVVAIILAGGTGARFGKGLPKQFVEVMEKPIIIHTLEIFQNNKNIDHIEIVCHKDYIDLCSNLTKQYGISKVRWIVNGGNSFPDSTVKGLDFLHGKLNDDDIVMIHGSCSPLVSDEVINDGIRVASEKKTAMAIQQLYLSTCLKENEYCSTRAIERESIIQVQFPLTFQFKYITDCYEKVRQDGSFDKLGLHLQYAVFANGGTMYFSKGDDKNIKITTQADKDFFEGYLLLKEKRAEL